MIRCCGVLAIVVAGCAAAPAPMPVERPAMPASMPAERAAPSIPIQVMRPDGTGPFPAIVMLHDCSGLGRRSSGAPRRWARELVAQGYVVAIPDSFSTRGHADGVCTDASPSRNEVGPLRRVRDAYEALDHLRSLPYVMRDRIGVMGGSHGGASTLATIAAVPTDGRALAERKSHGFAAAIALYPSCTIGNPRFSNEFHPVAPLLVLSGELDDWTPAQPCRRMADNARGAFPVKVKVYPGAHHGFDSNAPVRYVDTRVNVNSPTGRGATTGGDPDAWADSRREVAAFFERYLKAP